MAEGEGWGEELGKKETSLQTESRAVATSLTSPPAAAITSIAECVSYNRERPVFLAKKYTTSAGGLCSSSFLSFFFFAYLFA